MVCVVAGDSAAKALTTKSKAAGEPPATTREKYAFSVRLYVDFAISYSTYR